MLCREDDWEGKKERQAGVVRSKCMDEKSAVKLRQSSAVPCILERLRARASEATHRQQGLIRQKRAVSEESGGFQPFVTNLSIGSKIGALLPEKAGRKHDSILSTSRGMDPGQTLQVGYGSVHWRQKTSGRSWCEADAGQCVALARVKWLR